MKILFAADVPPDPDSGAAGTEFQTIKALRRLGHEVDEIWAADLPHWIRHGNLHYLLELPRGYRAAIGERAQRKQYDVFHVNQGHCYQAAKEHQRSGRLGVFVCRSHGLDDRAGAELSKWRGVLGIRDRSLMKMIPGYLLDRMLCRHDRLAYRHSDGVIVSGSADREFLLGCRGLDPSRVACIPQAPSEVFIASPSPSPSMTSQRLKRLLHVGGFAYWKDPSATAEATNRILESDLEARMTWVCPAASHGHIRQMLSPGASGRTTLVDWVSQAQLVNICDAHGIFLFPSLFEGFGKVFLEAMARGLCVIATPVGGARDIIQDGKNGLFVPFHDSGAIVSCVKRLWNNLDIAESIADNAALTARAYSWDRVAKETVDFYQQLAVMKEQSHV